MKKIVHLVLLLLSIFIISACRQDDETPKNGNNNGDETWKIQYDMVNTSPRMLTEVSVCYQIFPIAFADSTGDGYGDLRGMIDQVDYLSDVLGIDCIWLNPINPSTTYHKYDVTDYYGIDPQFGTMADFEELLEALDERGIILLMDLVINHTSDAHPWFINARLGTNRTYHDWYVWNTLEDRTAFPSKAGWHFEQNLDLYYFGYFWNRMPELNFDNPLVREEIKNIATFWLEKGVGGFRIDAARHIYDINEYPRSTNVLRENIDWFREFNYHVKSVNPDAIILGEVWASGSFVSPFYEGMDATFNFEFSEALIEGLKMGEHRNAAQVLYETRNSYRNVREDFIDSVFLTNHDMDRIMSEVNYNMDRARVAARVLFSLPGVSWIYYGEEIGMSGRHPDPARRQPFKWSMDSPYNTQGLQNAVTNHAGIQAWNSYNEGLAGVYEQLQEEDSLLNLYIEMIALKQNNPVLAFGEMGLITSNDSRMLMFTRSHLGEHYAVLHNMSGLTRNLTHELGEYEVIYQSDVFTDEAGVLTINPHQSVILKIQDASVTLNRYIP